MSILGDNIKMYREQAEYDKTTLAKLSGVGLSTISQIENGKRVQLNSLTVNKLADALNITSNHLLGNCEEGITDLYEKIELMLSDNTLTIGGHSLTDKEKELFLFTSYVTINNLLQYRESSEKGDTDE